MRGIALVVIAATACQRSPRTSITPPAPRATMPSQAQTQTDRMSQAQIDRVRAEQLQPLRTWMTKKPKPGSPKKVAAPPRQLPALAPDLARAVAPLIERVVIILEDARSQVVRTVNSTMVLAYWHVGREIVEFVQGGSPRAEYGEQVLEEISTHLQARLGRGYSVSNLRYFRIFYLRYSDRRPEIHHEARDESAGHGARPRKHHEARDELAAAILQGFSSTLSWTHYRTRTKVDDPAARAFYEIEAAREGWSVPHLERQLHTQLFSRLLKSRDKAGVMELARRGAARPSSARSI